MLKVPAVLCVCAAAWCSQALAAAAAVAAAGGRSDGGNFLDDKQWLTTISQYDKEVGQWNKFRDVSAAHPHSGHTGALLRGRGRGGGGRGARLPRQRGFGSRGGARRLGSWRLRCPLLARATGRAGWPAALEFGAHQGPTVPPPFLSGPQRFAKCWLALLNFSMVFLALVNTVDVLLRCIATKVTRIDPVY